ncbi:hypothetical protein EVJ58_g3167 [Rhodofomes roseus]|uniref:NCA2-domain-containing protein n=1 Tax=Rhodofomes roseus TaxID=34475 RepID=A0A4Y9YPF0_9APHY|nr:hypothetical protein EVJ58_g3167 [Rhodofomes roseus]
MSTFVSHLTNDLTQRILPPTTVPPSPPGGSRGQSKDELRALFVQLNQPVSGTSDASQHLGALEKLPVGDSGGFVANDDEEAALQKAVLGKLAVDLYAQALDVVLEDARRVEDELEWWADLERSSSSVALYFVQTFVSTFVGLGCSAIQVVSLPLDLTKGECRHKHQELKRLRDERAEMLGTLVNMRDLLAASLDDQSPEGMTKLDEFSFALQQFVRGDAIDAPAGTVPSLQNIAAALSNTTGEQSSSALRTPSLYAQNLARPSRLTLLWPRLVLLPPLALYAAKTAYASRASMCQMGREAVETMKSFWEQWLLEPLRGVVKTVRAGGEDGVIVSRESVQADIDSLERMAIALAQEKLHYETPQLEALSRQIQMGDLTSVMQIYEEDIKQPLKSAITGTLLRTLFIQLQKAKVDIDQALAGIDKLLKSQELTFAFVGVAPALAIVYALGGYLRGIWTGGRGKGNYGGKIKRASIWLKMRRIERLLIAQPKSHHKVAHSAAAQPSSIPALTSGLLLLSVSHLRAYAENHLPANSRFREGFLEDVVDLEDPALGRAEKLRVLDRMWRSWGAVLGWGNAAESAR